MFKFIEIHIEVRYLKTINSFLFAVFVLLFFSGCTKTVINPNIPDVYINITIDPNLTFYQELNTVGGWMYLTATPPSRGIIVYHKDLYEFVAFDRIPPNGPDNCCDDEGNCSRLVVDDYFPKVMDECNNISYLILDGSILEGNGQYPLVQYYTTYDGNLLRIYN